jgi:hypothetical protein
MTPAGMEPTIPASERPQTHALGHTATGIGNYLISYVEISQAESLSVIWRLGPWRQRLWTHTWPVRSSPVQFTVIQILSSPMATFH